MQEALKKFFNFEEYETNFKKEIIAGTTNFLTMAYILGVNTITVSYTHLKEAMNLQEKEWQDLLK